jgi:phosphoserine phosphatase RsbU/P
MPQLSSPAELLVHGASSAALVELRRMLLGGGYDAVSHLPGLAEPDHLATLKLLVIDGAATDAFEFCRRFRERTAEGYIPILFLPEGSAEASRQAALHAGADVCLLRPFSTPELLGQIAALLRIKEMHDRLFEKSAEIHRLNKRLQEAYHQIDQELVLAQRIQSSFLTQTLPQVPYVRFAVHDILCGRVGGDFYDVFRLDERHVGFYLADAMGHGVPASLLTIFVKKGFCPKEVSGQEYRLVPPGEVLGRLNRDLIDLRLSEQPFLTMIYGLLNHHDGTLHIARAGHPCPLYIPKEGEPRLWEQEGLLLGVVESRFLGRRYNLRPGDKLLLYSDGVDNASFESAPSGVESLLACARRHRQLPVQEFITRLASDLFGATAPVDDLTLFGIELGETDR